MKTCARCGKSKSPGAFYANRGWADGLHPYCKPCLLAYQRDRRFQRLDQENPDRRQWSRRFVRHDYFASIDEPVQAYVAGLLAADGNVLERQRRVSIELSTRDRDLVLLVRDQLAPGFAIRERRRRNAAETTILAITSPQLCADLARLGVTPRKSLTLRWPTSLDDIHKRPFLLGYFDGDGFITWSRTRSHVYPRWALLGTRSFLSEAMRFIASEAAIRPRKVHRRPNQRGYTLHIDGKDAWAVDRWLHSGEELGLARKRLAANAPNDIRAA